MSIAKGQFMGSRLSVAFVLLIAVCGRAACQTPTTTQASRIAPNSPEAVVAIMWRSILTTCAVPSEPGKTTAFFGNKEYLYEFRDAKPELVTLDLDAADRLNKIGFKGLAVMHYSANRYFDRQDLRWLPFKAGTEDPREKAIHGAITFSSEMQMEVEKRDGRWFFKVRNPLTLMTGDSFQQDTLSQIAIKKSCAELTSRNPFAAGQ